MARQNAFNYMKSRNALPTPKTDQNSKSENEHVKKKEWNKEKKEWKEVSGNNSGKSGIGPEVVATLKE
jgi:hypothetical protein